MNQCPKCGKISGLRCMCEWSISAMKEGKDFTISKPWVGLTDDEIAVICGECAASAHRTDDISYARAIEAKLREKNA